MNAVSGIEDQVASLRGQAWRVGDCPERNVCVKEQAHEIRPSSS